jgi:hypothetical protein
MRTSSGGPIVDRLEHESSRPEEAAELLDPPLSTIRHAVFGGSLKATAVDDHIRSIRQDAFLA